MQLPFHTLDVFTTERFGGNALAVVLEADGLTPSRMQMIAREFNISETVFVLKASSPGHSARVRIFTPGAEVPFAGHPTVGAAALLAGLRTQGGDGERDAIVVLEQEIGVVRVGVRLKPRQAAFAEFDAPRLAVSDGEPAHIDQLAAALDLSPSDIGFESHRPMRYQAGNGFALVPIATLAAIGRARVVAHHWSAALGGGNIIGAYLYTRQTVGVGAAFHARMFAPAVGIAEDPATGSAAVCLAAAIHRFDKPADGLRRCVIEQGYEMGRPSLIELALDIRRGELASARIGGHAVRVMSGVIEV